LLQVRRAHEAWHAVRGGVSIAIHLTEPETLMNRYARLVALAMAVVGALASPAGAQSLSPDIVVTKVINAPVEEVWKAWTTTEGIESFFAPRAAKVEPVPGGAFELWFGVNNPEGTRGSEGCLVHSVKPMEQLVIEWNAPPDFPVIRKLRTLVYLDFKPLPGNRTELTLRNFGYGDGPEWAKSKAYFESAWPAVVGNLEKKYAAR
jgi:uncharacterized protein YndB with AHSA1/START domain